MGHEARRRKMTLPRGSSLGEQWADWYEHILQPIDPSPVQVEETKRAFYAGALCMFHLVAGVSGDVPDDEPGIEQGAERMEALLREAEEFFERLGKQR